MIEEVTKQWGKYQTLMENKKDLAWKVKILEVMPEKSLSMQRHKKRSEIWLVLEGKGEVFVDASSIPLKKGVVFVLNRKEWHQLKNTSKTKKLRVLEVQFGEVCEEDDIERRL